MANNNGSTKAEIKFQKDLDRWLNKCRRQAIAIRKEILKTDRRIQALLTYEEKAPLFQDMSSALYRYKSLISDSAFRTTRFIVPKEIDYL